MELKTFVENTLLEIGKDLEYVDDVINAIIEMAKKKPRKLNCVGISDDEIKKFIVDYDYSKTKTAKKLKEDKPKKTEKKPELLENLHNEKHETFEQISLL